MNKITNKEEAQRSLFKQLKKLDEMQFKIFYCFFVHQWANNSFFISTQKFFNLWCELNLLCHQSDESFPDMFDDHDEIQSFCKQYPYYFIERLPLELVAILFCENIDDRMEILSEFARMLSETDLPTALNYAVQTLQINESVEMLVQEIQDHIKYFS